jgi:hypothetical protein
LQAKSFEQSSFNFGRDDPHLKLRRCPRSLAAALAVPLQRDRSSHSLHSAAMMSSSSGFSFSAFPFFSFQNALSSLVFLESKITADASQ